MSLVNPDVIILAMANRFNPVAKIVFIFIISAGILGTALFPAACSSLDFSKPEQVSIGFTVADTTVLLMIAEEQNFFAANGVDATLKPYNTALAALAGMKNGEVDIAENAEFPIVSEAFQKTQIKAS